MEQKTTHCKVAKADRYQGIDFEALLQGLNRHEQDGCFTVAEMSDHVGLSKSWCRTRIRELIKRGRVECSGTVARTRIDGRACHVGAYRMIPQEEP